MPGVNAKQQAVLYVLQKYGELTDEEIVLKVYEHQPKKDTTRPFTDKQVREARAVLVTRGLVKQGGRHNLWMAT